MESRVRLQKYIANHTEHSRRKAEKLIEEGHVSINDNIVKTQGITINPENDIVKLDGKKLISTRENIYIILHKPSGYISTRSDNHKRETVMDLTPYKNVYPVGRLDKDTEGLLLLTNDGDFAYEVMHPKFEHEKEYIVHLKNKLTLSDTQKLENGITIEDLKTSPCKISNIDTGKHFTKCNITIHEGRKRQIKRMFEIIHNQVIYLKRIRIGNLHIGTLKRGTYKIIPKKTAEKALKKQ